MLVQTTVTLSGVIVIAAHHLFASEDTDSLWIASCAHPKNLKRAPDMLNNREIRSRTLTLVAHQLQAFPRTSMDGNPSPSDESDIDAPHNAPSLECPCNPPTGALVQTPLCPFTPVCASADHPCSPPSRLRYGRCFVE
jgi:hypothetical protein